LIDGFISVICTFKFDKAESFRTASLCKEEEKEEERKKIGKRVLEIILEYR
jgi:hypothetical protein